MSRRAEPGLESGPRRDGPLRGVVTERRYAFLDECTERLSTRWSDSSRQSPERSGGRARWRDAG